MVLSRKKNNKKNNPQNIPKHEEARSTHKSNKAMDITEQKQSEHEEIWVPETYFALKALVTARLCSAMWGLINDCDETYNYWEPTHHLLYNKGFQTWEYSPEYALRSYTYLLIHAVPAYLYGILLQQNRMLIFFFIRCFLAVGSSVCEVYFFKGICKQFGPNIGRLSLGISIFAAGMFISSSAYLPSSFAMYMIFLSYGAWFHNRLQLAIFTTALSSFLGWPFAALIGVPIAYDILIVKKKHTMFLKWCFVSTVTIMAPTIQIDTTYFGRFVVAPLKLVLYNVFTSHGPDLYGTSHSSFYLHNGLLNFNVVFLLALISLPLYVIGVKCCGNSRSKSDIPYWLPASAMYLWLVVFTLQPHKEERFLFPMYPLIPFAGAVAIDSLQKMWFHVFNSSTNGRYDYKTSGIAVLMLVLTSTVSLSRIFSQYQGYHGPFSVFIELSNLHQSGELKVQTNYSVCYGKEWHRFPSSFFLPDNSWNVEFLASDFEGQLPQHFSSAPDAAAIVPDHMNDKNQEEVTRYVPLSSCDFIVDFENGRKTAREPIYSELPAWEILHSVKFLDAEKSPLPWRAFYVPFLTEYYCSYGDYVLLRNNARKIKHL